MDSDYLGSLAVLCPSYPGDTGGYEIAIRTSLKVYSEIFNPIWCFVVVPEHIQPGDYSQEFPDIDFKIIQYKQEPKGKRFLKSLCSKYPAGFRNFMKYKFELIDMFKSISHPINYIGFEDVPLFYFKEILEGSGFDPKAWILHSHNVIADIFHNIAQGGNIVYRKAWEYESLRNRRFEETAIRGCSYLFPITQEDSIRFRELYSIKPQGVFSVSFPDAHQAPFSKRPHRLLYIGGVDARKKHGLQWFIKEIWEKVIKEEPTAEFHIAGSGSESLRDIAKGIRVYGKVKSSTDFLNSGTIFINPQLVGSGVKLKSIDALRHGLALISTIEGTKGLNGQNGRDFYSSDNPNEIVYTTLELLRNRQKAETMGKNGYQFFRISFLEPEIFKKYSLLIRKAIQKF